MNELKLPGLNKNIINETQTFIEKKLTFKQTRDNFELFKRLPFQTDLDENKVAEMKESYLRNKEYFHFKNKIVIAVVSNNFDDDYNLYVVDGQHRLEMAKDLCEDFNGELFICYYKIDSDKKMKELFREINRDSFKNNKYISLDEFQENLYDLTKEYLKSKYSIYFSERKSSTSYRYSLTEFLNELVERLYFEKFNNLQDIKIDIESKNRQFNKLIDYQEYYNENCDNFYKDEHTSVKNGIIITLKNNNFIDYLTNEKKYTKTFFRDGAYIDSDGYMGVWDMSTENKLDITTTNSINNVKTKSSYDIVTLNAAQLHIKITGTKGTYQYFFVIAN